jgi:hypothetical protein
MREGHIEKGRSGRVSASDETFHLGSGPVCVVKFLRQMPWSGYILIVGHSVVELLPGVALVAQEELVIIDNPVLSPALLGEQNIVKPYPVPLWKYMQLSHCICLVPGIPKGLSQGRKIRHDLVLVKNPVAMGSRSSSGHKSAPGRNTDRTFTVGPVEADSRTGYLINCGGLNNRMPLRTQQGARPVIGTDQENILSIFCPVRILRHLFLLA